MCNCKIGFYGIFCDKFCNNFGNCIIFVCEKFMGDCSGNCVDGWYGSKCGIYCLDYCKNKVCNC